MWMKIAFDLAKLFVTWVADRCFALPPEGGERRKARALTPMGTFALVMAASLSTAGVIGFIGRDIMRAREARSEWAAKVDHGINAMASVESRMTAVESKVDTNTQITGQKLDALAKAVRRIETVMMEGHGVRAEADIRDDAKPSPQLALVLAH